MHFARQAQGFEVSDAQCVGRVQLLCCNNLSVEMSFRVAVTGLRMPRLIYFVASAMLPKISKKRENSLEF